MQQNGFIKNNLDYKPKLYGVDISRAMLKKARKIKGINQKYIKHSQAESTPFNDNMFDLVFTFGLLMHIPADEIEKIIDEMIRVAADSIIIAEELCQDNNLFKINNYTFNHDYKGLFRKKGWLVLESEIFQNNEQFQCIRFVKKS